MRAELLSALATCEDHVAQNEQNIANQEVRVTKLEAGGVTASLSKSLLKTFQQLRQSHLTRRGTILRDLATLHHIGELRRGTVGRPAPMPQEATLISGRLLSQVGRQRCRTLRPVMS